MNILRVFLLLSLCGNLSAVSAKPSDKETKRVLYNDVTEGLKPIDREAKAAYAGKFRIVDVTRKEGFSPGAYKGIYHTPFRDLGAG